MTLLLPLIVVTAMTVAPTPVRPESDVPVSVGHEHLIQHCGAHGLCGLPTPPSLWRAP